MHSTGLSGTSQPSELQLDHLRVSRISLHQLTVFPHIKDLAGVQHHDFISLTDCREPMRNDQAGILSYLLITIILILVIDIFILYRHAEIMRIKRKQL